MSLSLAHDLLGWPAPRKVLQPPGAGPGVFARLAEAKIGCALRRFHQSGHVRVGVLCSNPDADATESPLAVVCEFSKPAGDKVLWEAHRLAWNFSRSPLLITLEPHLIRAWSCCKEPQPEDSPDRLGAQIADANITSPSRIPPSQRAAQLLHWVYLASGEFFQRNDAHFRPQGSADRLLVDNLVFVRRLLIEDGLHEDVCHDLLARVIFVQFLFHRKDSGGIPALHDERLESLRKDGVLAGRYTTLPEILSNYEDAYALFRWLNERFNGDLFPGKGHTESEREKEWQNERKRVSESHLRDLADFVEGKTKISTGQMNLWPSYSFDVIPLEFISSIYEVFVRKAPGVVYTPGHLVDLVLDGVLPWDGEAWDLKVLDPACGSGIFLVKTYQRLIHRWKTAHPGQDVDARVLRRLLERNLRGVDVDEHAVRVASFSLYLAMCDEIDPRHYWTQVRFPRMRASQMRHTDFFREDVPGIRTGADAGKYDLIVGNPPWGQNTMTESARQWAEDPEHTWRTYYKIIGPLFLAKAAVLSKPQGVVSMLQPWGLFYHEKAAAFRDDLLRRHTVEEVVNLSAFRRRLFPKGSVSPACVVRLRGRAPDDQPITYIFPKPTKTGQDCYRITVGPYDVHHILPDEALADSLIWVTLMWGGRRDLSLIRRLKDCPTLAKLKEESSVWVRQGIVRGDKTKERKDILGRPLLESKPFPKGTFLQLDPSLVEENRDPKTHSRDSTNFDAFRLPQLLLKQSWTTSSRRFQAAMVKQDPKTGPVLCSQSYISVHAPSRDERVLEGACVAYNSILAVYAFFLTSGNVASYRPKAGVHECLSVPIPDLEEGVFRSLASYDDGDAVVRRAFGFKDAEWVLVEDLFKFTLPDFKGGSQSLGRKITRRSTGGKSATLEPELWGYCEYFLRVLKSAFGRDENICATIFQEKDNSSPLPVRMVEVYLDLPRRDNISVERIDSEDFLKRLFELNEALSRARSTSESLLSYERAARIYDTLRLKRRAVPTVFIVKADRRANWTRSRGLRDADEVAADVLMWRSGGERLLPVAEGTRRG